MIKINYDIDKNNKSYYEKYNYIITFKDYDGSIIETKDEETSNEKIAEAKATLMTDTDKILNESHYIIIQPQAAMAIIDYKTGQVKGLAGGRGDKKINRGLNRATQSPRQAGSTFKTDSMFL